MHWPRSQKVKGQDRTFASDHVPDSVHLYAAVLPVAVDTTAYGRDSPSTSSDDLWKLISLVTEAPSDSSVL